MKKNDKIIVIAGVIIFLTILFVISFIQVLFVKASENVIKKVQFRIEDLVPTAKAKLLKVSKINLLIFLLLLVNKK